MPGRSAADDDVPDAVNNEILVRGVVVDTALAGHWLGFVLRQVARSNVGEPGEQGRVVCLLLCVVFLILWYAHGQMRIAFAAHHAAQLAR